MQKFLKFWTFFVLGLLYISVACDARAVNVSNTWTMPQEGLNVFYRFFRDRISWFEADAVCQFHHANLVTVDNSFQFDATRDLLRELDVNDIVWIGLMRPQSSERFMWSNSRSLAADTGYWAESLPLMDSPLCAVIDPIRDYRWHALRCGGPETASFLCEMPVPSWADACIIKEMPALTMQYMADTASIELIRNCGEEGLLRQSCRGKEDREHVVRELICPKERYETQRINDITSSHFKSLQIINSIPSDNNENNDIELLPLTTNAAGTQSYANANAEFNEQQTQTEKNTVQKLIEQFNVDELMQADQAGNEPNTGYRIPGEIPKPVKKSAKKVIVLQHDEYPKKDNNRKSKYADIQAQYQQQQQQKEQQQRQKEEKLTHLPLEDMMLGDQPVAGDSVELHSSETSKRSHEDNEQSNEIEQPLPHIKKVLPQDLRTMAPVIERSQQAEEKMRKEHEWQLQKELKLQTTVETTTGTTTTTTEAAKTTSGESTTKPSPVAKPTINNPVTPTIDVDSSDASTFDATSRNVDVADATTAAAATATSLHTASTAPTATIGHPMHPQQPRSSVISEETQPAHIKETADNSHFIPPMLLVKSHYVPPAKQHEHEHEQLEHEHQQHEHELEQHEQHEHEHEQLEHEHQQHEHYEHEHQQHERENLQHEHEPSQHGREHTPHAQHEHEHAQHEQEHPQHEHEHQQHEYKYQQNEHEHQQQYQQNNQRQQLIRQHTTEAAAAATSDNSNVVATTIKIIKDEQQEQTTVQPLELTTMKTDEKLVLATKQHTDFSLDTNVKHKKEIIEEERSKSKLAQREQHEIVTTRTPTTTPTAAVSQATKDIAATENAAIQIMKNENENVPTTEGNVAVGVTTVTEAAETVTAKTTTTVAAIINQIKLLPTTMDTKIQHEISDIVGEEKHDVITTDAAPSPIKTTITTTARAETAVTGTTAAITKAATATLTETVLHNATANVATTKVAKAVESVTTPPSATTIITPSSTTTTTKAPIAETTTTHNFLKEETEMPFKPNRRRSLTKPETASYFKKILG